MKWHLLKIEWHFFLLSTYMYSSSLSEARNQGLFLNRSSNQHNHQLSNKPAGPSWRSFQLIGSRKWTKASQLESRISTYSLTVPTSWNQLFKNANFFIDTQICPLASFFLWSLTIFTLSSSRVQLIVWLTVSQFTAFMFMLVQKFCSIYLLGLYSRLRRIKQKTNVRMKVKVEPKGFSTSAAQ